MPLTLGTYSVVGLVAFLAIRRSKAKKPDPFTSSPPINASSVEEELFIKEFMKIVVNWSKKKHELEVDTDESVEIFKSQIYTMTGVAPERQKIMTKGVLLKDDTDFNTLNIKEGQKFMMTGTIGELPEVPHQKTLFIEDMSDQQLAETITISDQDNQRNLVMSLCELYNQLNLTTEGYSPWNFLQTLRTAFPQFAQRNNHGFMQQDAEECWSQIVSSLNGQNLLLSQNAAAEEGSSTSSTQSSFVEKYMTGEYTSILKLKHDGDDKEAALDEEPALDEELEKHSPTLNRQAKYTKKSRISRLPSYLTVHFVRFFWKSQQQMRAKILRKVIFPFEFDVTEFCTDELKKKLSPAKNRLIELEKEREEAKRMKKLTKNSDQKEIEEIKKKDESGIEEVKKLIDPDLVKDVGSNFTGLYDLCAVLTHTGRSADSGEIKNELGDGSGCPYRQVCASYTRFISQKRPPDCYVLHPIFFIYLAGPYLGIAGAVFGERCVVEPLTPLNSLDAVKI
ncbi:4753_t:CDS:10 [Entrophospora sp. SA101]|nr:4753_t:CDS:10 [Entrophospora sp. SA101]